MRAGPPPMPLQVRVRAIRLLKPRRAAGHLTELFGHGFVALYFSDEEVVPRGLAALETRDEPGPARLTLWRIARAASAPSDRVIVDDLGEAWQRYAATDRTLVVIRPDGYILGRWIHGEWDAVEAALAPFRCQTGTHRIDVEAP